MQISPVTDNHCWQRSNFSKMEEKSKNMKHVSRVSICITAAFRIEDPKIRQQLPFFTFKKCV